MKIIPFYAEEHMYNFIKMNNINIITIDKTPYPEIAIRLQNVFQGRVYRCVFDYRDKRKFVFEMNKKTRMINLYIRGNEKVPWSQVYRVFPKVLNPANHWKAQQKVRGNGETPEDKQKNKHMKFDK